MDYGLIGEKLGHSYSKIIHELIGWYEYDLKEIPRDELKDFIVSRNYKGLNVTIPYKQDVMPLLDYIDAGAASIGAVNCIVNKDGKLSGYNTDYYGLKMLIENSGHSIKGAKTLILGTGGTSNTACKVLEDLGAATIHKVSRSVREGVITYDEAESVYNDADFIINTTPSGMYPNIGVAATDITKYPALQAVFDVVYNPPRTKLMLDCQERNIPAFGGLRMLVYQAIAAAELFTDRKLDASVVESIYRTVKNSSENIVLIGMPGVGKTTLGKRLARELHMEFVDTDVEIVRRDDRQISDIFAVEGEKYFRDLESEVIRDIASLKKTVIATGGGAILRRENVEVLKSFGTLFLLDRPLESLVPTGNRPLANNVSKIERLYNERMPIYRSVADYVVDGGLGVSYEVKEIKRIRDEH